MNIILAAGLMVAALVIYDQLPSNLKPALQMFLIAIIAAMLVSNYGQIKSQVKYIFTGKDDK